MAGRIEFFDLRQPDDADATLARALQAAGEADDALLGSAILAIPRWAGRREEAAERMRAAHTYARHGNASSRSLAWLDAVEAECETRCGHPRPPLRACGVGAGPSAAGADGRLATERPIALTAVS